MKTLKDLWPAVTFLVLYTGLLFGGFSWMLNVQTSNTNNSIKSINSLLTNHISETNKKIDQLSNRFDRLSDRFDRLSDRFNSLYELLLKEKG